MLKSAGAFSVSWKDRIRCKHVLVKLPDGRYFDGGNGVITELQLMAKYPQGTYIDEMVEFDLELLDRWSYSLKRDYEECPNFSDEITARLIRTHLTLITNDDFDLVTWKEVGGSPMFQNARLEGGPGAPILAITCSHRGRGPTNNLGTYRYQLSLTGIDRVGGVEWVE